MPPSVPDRSSTKSAREVEPSHVGGKPAAGMGVAFDWGALLGSVALVAAVFAGLLTLQSAQLGRPGLEKMLTELAMPVGMLWFVLTLAISYGAVGWWRRRHRGERGVAANRPLLVLSVALWLALMLLGNRSVATWVWNQTQYPLAESPWARGAGEARGAESSQAASGDESMPEPAIPASDGAGSFDAVILLGGGVHADPFDSPQLGGDGDRIRPPLQLWHAGRVERIIVTGTSALPGERGPADLTEELLISLGVPATAITKVSGRNTSEEMAALGELLAALPSPPGGGAPRVGLVTSAYHMPRALRLARGEGLELVPLPVGYRGLGTSLGWARDLVPTSEALNDITACWKEWLAATVGR